MIADLFSSFVPAIRNSLLENVNIPLNDPRIAEELGGGSVSDSGLAVNYNSALTLGVVFGIVSNISGDMASMPLECYKRLPNDAHAIDWTHPSAYLAAEEANSETPAFEFWRRFLAHELLFSNAYSYIERKSPNRPPLALYNLLPDRTRPLRLPDGRLVYVTDVDGEPEVLFKEEVLHVKGLSIENCRGVDVVNKARNAIGLALAAQGYTSKFFANGAISGGILTIPPAFTEKAAQKLEEGMRNRARKDNWFKTMIVRDGAKFESATIDAQKAQLHELNEDEVRDLCRYWNYPTFKAGLRDSISYNSVEMEQLIYLQTCLHHRMTGISAEVRMKLLSPEERASRSHYFEHDETQLIRMDRKAKSESLAMMRANEVINANDWLRDIGWPLRSDPKANEYYNPNTKGTPTDQGQATPEPGQKPAQPAKKAAGAMRGVLADAINRVARRVTFDAKSHAKKSTKFVQWIDGGALEHRSVFDDALRPAADAWSSICGGTMAGILCDLSGRFFAELIERLSPLLEPPNLAAQLGENVTAACLKFEAEIENILLNPIMEKIQ